MTELHRFKLGDYCRAEYHNAQSDGDYLVKSHWGVHIDDNGHAGVVCTYLLWQFYRW